MKRAFVFSDLHLGGESGFEMCPARNQKQLAETLVDLGRHRSTDVDVHVVLAGDIVDFLAEPPYESFTATSAEANRKLERILANTAAVWDAIAQLVRDGCELTLMLGNHDIELAFPAVQRTLLDRVGTGHITVRSDGEPLRLGSAIVLHGNADDTWNYVPYSRLAELGAGNDIEYDELVVPGSELVTRVMNPIKREHPWVDLLKPETSALLPLLAVLQPSTILEIPTVAKLYAKSQLRALGRVISDDIAAPVSPVLENHWTLACEFAGASDDIGARGLFDPLRKIWCGAIDATRRIVRTRLQRALGVMVSSNYFDTRCEDRAWTRSAENVLHQHDAKTVVFGHTHIAKRLDIQGGRYLNTGTWADLLALPPEAWARERTPETNAVFDAFIDDLVNNNVEHRRTLVATYVRIDHDESDATAELHFADGRRVEDGDLWTSLR